MNVERRLCTTLKDYTELKLGNRLPLYYAYDYPFITIQCIATRYIDRWTHESDIDISAYGNTQDKLFGNINEILIFIKKVSFIRSSNIYKPQVIIHPVYQKTNDNLHSFYNAIVQLISKNNEI